MFNPSVNPYCNQIIFLLHDKQYTQKDNIINGFRVVEIKYRKCNQQFLFDDLKNMLIFFMSLYYKTRYNLNKYLPICKSGTSLICPM